MAGRLKTQTGQVVDSVALGKEAGKVAVWDYKVMLPSHHRQSTGPLVMKIVQQPPRS